VIDEDTSKHLVYDNVTSSYPVELPQDYYKGYIDKAMPDEAGTDKWETKPHHIESITNHTLSIKDDVKNTRYFSHYNQGEGKQDDKINYFDKTLGAIDY
jgi:hypothetical protein